MLVDGSGCMLVVGGNGSSVVAGSRSKRGATCTVGVGCGAEPNEFDGAEPNESAGGAMRCGAESRAGYDAGRTVFPTPVGAIHAEFCVPDGARPPMPPPLAD